MATRTARASISRAEPSKQYGADRPAGLEADDVAGEHHLGAEAGRLGDRAMGEVGAGEPLGEPEVVLDATRSGPPARRARPARRPRCCRPSDARVDRGGEPGRSGADDAEVVERLLGLRAQPERFGQLDGGGRAQRSPSGSSDERQVVGPGAGQVQQPLRPPRRGRRRASGRARGCGRGSVFTSWLRSDQRWPDHPDLATAVGVRRRQSSRRSSSTG